MRHFHRRLGLALLGLAGLIACERSTAPAQQEPPRRAAASETTSTPEPGPELRPRIDVHVHLVAGAVDELLAALDRNGIARAVVLASPHLDPELPSPVGGEGFDRWRESNDRLLTLTEAHRARLLPFLTVDPAEVQIAELDAWLEAGACGVKLYAGHRSFHARPLADPAHATLLRWLEERGVPLLLHLNTFRYEADLDELLTRYPKLDLVCAHLCGSRTDLDRLERILAAHPRLRVDTSHGAGLPGVDGFTNLEREHERIRALISAAPERFLFGSDLVTLRVPVGSSATAVEWDAQLAANLGLLEAERFDFGRRGLLGHGSIVPGSYRGLALDDEVLAQVLAQNAEAWLERCIPPGNALPHDGFVARRSSTSSTLAPRARGAARHLVAR